MKILFVTSEAHPLIKTGGLADVSGALPAALRGLGLDVRILLPGYPDVLERIEGACASIDFTPVDEATDTRLLDTAMPDGTPVMVYDHPALFRRPGGPYSGPDGLDWPDNAIRFGRFARLAAQLGSAQNSGWQPDIVHCNDWQTGLTPAYLHFSPDRHARTVFSIHNLAFQGLFNAELLPALALPPESMAIEGLEFHGHLSFLKAGAHYCDHITTVSPTYAREIQQETLGFGMHHLLAYRHEDLTGILNGIDTVQWDPATDQQIYTNYQTGEWSGKAENKARLQQQLGLSVDPDRPLLGMVSRLTEQKGIDLVLGSASQLIATGAQLALLGTGSDTYAAALRALAQQWPEQVSATLSYDETLAHRIEAGADIFLMPSSYEPCGLNQLYSMRYGTPPVVRRTGGLADSVIDCTTGTLADGSATGFVFDDADTGQFQACVNRALALWQDKPAWRQLQRNGMQRDFGWEKSAMQYIEVYEQVMQKQW